MDEITPPPGREEGKDDPGCAYVLEGPGSKRTCGAPARPASSYCMHHHSLCHIACGSTAEANRARAPWAVVARATAADPRGNFSSASSKRFGLFRGPNCS